MQAARRNPKGLVILIIVAALLAVPATQALIVGYQSLGARTYSVHVFTSTYDASCSCSLVDFATSATGMPGSGYAKVSLSAGDNATAVYHPALLWANAYWDSFGA